MKLYGGMDLQSTNVMTQLIKEVFCASFENPPGAAVTKNIYFADVPFEKFSEES